MSADGSITLDAYVALLEERIRRFKQDWLFEHRANPHSWPIAMTEAEWDEQFQEGGTWK